MKRLAAVLLWSALLMAQSKTGELRLRVTDPAGLGIRCSVELVSESSQFRQSFVTDDSGTLDAQRLPFGIYRLEIAREGFAPVSHSVEIVSTVPTQLNIRLNVAGVKESVTVTDKDTLIDPDRVSAVNQIGSATIRDRESSLPGRSLQDLVDSQPGWLYEGNAVLHPRGSEYQTQFVVNGIPLTENRSPGKGPDIEADNVESMSVYTAGIPAEYGRKMGGIVEVNTARDTREGLHGQLVLAGGSFDTVNGYAMLQYLAGKNMFGISADGSMTSYYLNPPVPQNFTSTATLGDFSGNYERQFTDNDRVNLMFRHELVRYQVPNEQVQQAAGQRQDGRVFENLGAVSWQHIFSSNVVGDLRGMFRDNSTGLSSNPLSTPIIVFQQNHFTEAYFNGSIAIHHGRHEWKAGFESDNTFLHERFADVITNPAYFDPGTPATFSFIGNRPDLEQSAYVQDLVRLGNWTLSAGLRWDHYQLLVNQNAVSPRLGVSRYFAKAGLLLHAAYDRVFQTPAFENILLSSSPAVVVLNPDVLRLPVEPSHGNYYELGMTRGFLGKFSLDVNGYLRQMNNFADDDLLLNTPVSFPIAFRRASIYGAEGKINIPHWGRLSGFVSYSYMVGSAYFPVTGGLFLGESATNALTDLSGRFWVSQDQRNTARARFRYQFIRRFWGAVGAQYGSGLPVDFDGTFEQALAEYGPQVISQVNFDRGRVKPNFSLDTSLGADLWVRDNVAMRLQFDVINLTDRFNLINFAGLFSGNSVAPPRTYGVRLQTSF
ncbi:MAG TPA: TonB-dependent receptor [Candidatus Binatia bacterium]|nr:TonB-dependent receptor [Candidatus Binatia bacterium]